jgi:hypothetical protein
MRTTLFTLLLLSSLSAQAQTFYIVQDPDGFVNARTGPGKEYPVTEKIRNKAVLKADTNLSPSKGWIPLLYCGNNGNPVYIFHDRLKEIPKEITRNLHKELGDEFPYTPPYNEVYLMDFEHPDVYLMYYSGDCALEVKDMRKSKTLFSADIPICPTIIRDDTLSFYILFDFGEPLLPAFVIYKLYKDEKGNYGVYTEITPEPKKIPVDKARRNIQKIRDDIKGQENYMIVDGETGRLIVEACIAGVDAEDILRNSDCDASICDDIANFLTLIEAYKLSKLKPKQ